MLLMMSCLGSTVCGPKPFLKSEILLDPQEGTFGIRQLHKKGYYGRIYNAKFLTNQSGQYKGTPFRTFSNGTFIGGYSDHYPTYIVITK